MQPQPTEDEVRHQLDLMRSVTDHAAEALFLLDAEGRTTFANPAAERMFGWSADELQGRVLHDVLHYKHPDGSSFPSSECPLGGAFRSGQSYHDHEDVFLHKDGRFIPVACSNAPILEDGHAAGAVLVVRDIAEQKRGERLAAAQFTTAQALATSGTIREAMPRVLEAICGNLEWDVGQLWTVDERAMALRRVEAWFAPSVSGPQFEVVSRDLTLAPGVGLPGRVWTSQEPLWLANIADVENFPRSSAASKEGLRGAFAFPILLGGEVLGVMEFFSRDVRPPDDDLLRAMVVLGSQIGQFIERSRAEEELRRKEQELTDFVENATIGLHMVGPDGTILWANRAELDLLGYSPEEYIGRPIAEYHADEEAIADILARLKGGEELHNCEARLRCKDGSIRHVLISSNVYREDGRFRHTRCFTRDITDRKRAEEVLKEQSRRKDEFLAMLAHELRNPLAAINNGVALLQRADSTEEDREWAERIIERQVKHLTSLIDDLLDVSRITRGKIQLKKQVLDAAPILAHAIETAQPLVEERKHLLSVSYTPGSLPVEADPTRLEQIVVNLLTNAAKYTESGGRIWLTAENVGKSIVIRVRDNGMGIPPEKLPTMFELFAQGERTLARSEGGLGIGLTLVKTLTEMHGGNVSATSEGLGKGSEFTVRLPAGKRLEATAHATTKAPRQGPRQSLRILIVDDNLDTARGMAKLLRLTGHEIQMAHTGPEAIEQARAHRPEVVLLDIGLPGMDGYQVARQLRGDVCQDARLVAVSGYGQEEDRRRSREAGFDHHLVKPVDFEALLTVLAGWRARA